MNTTKWRVGRRKSGELVALIFISQQPGNKIGSIMPFERTSPEVFSSDALVHQQFAASKSDTAIQEDLLGKAGISVQDVLVAPAPWA